MILLAGLALLVAGGASGAQESGLEGVWDARLYRLAGGQEHEVRDATEAVAEPARVRIEGESLEISFPSGNVLEFVRAS